MHDKQLGYILLILLFCVLAATTIYAVFTQIRPMYRQTISFPSIGNLKIEDPITLKGRTIAAVNHIEWRGKDVLVGFQTDRPIDLFQDYQITLKDRGLMGDRVVEITSGKVLPKKQGNDTLLGKNEPGISEAIGLMWKLRDVVQTFSASSRQFLRGDSTHTSFVQQFRDIANTVDTLSIRISSFSHAYDSSWAPKIDTVINLIDTAARVTARVAGYTTQAMKDIPDILSKCDAMLSTLDTICLNAKPLLSETTYDSVSTNVERISETVTEFKNIITRIQENGLPLPARFVF